MRLQLLSILLGSGSVVAHSLFIFAPIACGGSVFGPCSVMQYLVSFLVAIISLRKRELVALLELSSCCHVAVCLLCLFLTVPWVDLQSDCGISWSYSLTFGYVEGDNSEIQPLINSPEI